MNPPQKLILALTGASGMPYGFRLLECLLQSQVQVYFLYSQAAQWVAKEEQNLTLPSRPSETELLLSERFKAKPGQLTVFSRDDWSAPIASGSNTADAMVICPCSMGTLAAVAQGLADNLITRAADVILKEQRKLIMVPRETPLSTIHLENMLRLSRAGVVILPPNPGFYTHPQTLSDLVDFVVARILDQLTIAHRLTARWGETSS